MDCLWRKEKGRKKKKEEVIFKDKVAVLFTS